MANVTEKGSPPRMRGKPTMDLEKLTGDRITPAHAGKTTLITFSTRHRKDHPRACGENTSLFYWKCNGKGSPPRMRGKRLALKNGRGDVGITPAHAGKTGNGRLAAARGRDHPRACGENSFRSPAWTAPAGSPPRMRGKHFGNGVFPWLILVLSLDPL